MMLIPLLLALIGPHEASLVPQDDSQADGNKLVKVALLAERAEIQPGSTFTLAVRCRIERRWHVYWGDNAGDAGLPLTAVITGPPGYEIGPLHNPWPKREELEADIVEYIHEGEIAMLADVKVPADAKPGSAAAFEVKSHWLVCTTVCVQGAGTASITLPVAEKEKPANEAEFKAWRTHLPRPWSEMTRTMSTWSGDAGSPKLTLLVPGATALEFFPYKSPTTEMKSRKVEVGKQGSTLTLELAFSSKEAKDVPAARGVLWVKTDKGEGAYVLDQPFKKP
jgi:DsbC/DsbD-like thiol-disulfide interchange protein